jgi:uncharacterized protein YcfJ
MVMMRGLIALLVIAPVVATAQSLHFTANVVRITPVHQIVTETLQQCVTETVTPQSGSGGAVTGAIIGGVIGSQVAKGGDRTLGAGVGAVAGAVIGDNAAKQPITQQRCTPIQNSRLVIVGYDVTWEYLGRQVTQRMDRDPGQYVTVTVTAR